MKREMGKKGQVTIFIILGIVIVAFAIFAFAIYPRIKPGGITAAKSPEAYIETCIKEEIEDAVKKVSLQGGSIEPEHYIGYNDDKIEYLCYSGNYYEPCIVQQPLLKPHIEKEVKDEIEDEAEACFESLKNSYENKGYDAKIEPGEIKVELLPGKIFTTFNYSLTLTKSANTEKYDDFVVVLNNNLYELIAIANSLLEWEIVYGKADVTTYMDYYPKLKVEKIPREDGTNIYIITNRAKGNKFQFASRSIAWPSGV